jgi:hypothetical protein
VGERDGSPLRLGLAVGEGVALGEVDGPVGVGTGGVRHAHVDLAGRAARSGTVRRGGAGGGAATVVGGTAAGVVAVAVGTPAWRTTARGAAAPRPIPVVAPAPAVGAAAAIGYASAVAGLSRSSEPSPFTTAK